MLPLQLGGLSAQDTESEKEQISSILAYGFQSTTRGLGLHAVYFKGVGPNKTSFGFDMHSVKGHREIRIRSAYQDLGRKYIFDKINYFYVLAPTVGISREVFPRSSFNKINVTVNAAAGPALGLLRPYILEVAIPIPNQPGYASREEHQYDPERFNFGNIIGQADPFSGDLVGAATVGGAVRMQIFVDFARHKRTVRGMTATLNADIFPKRVPIMAESENHYVYIAGGLGILFGHKW